MNTSRWLIRAILERIEEGGVGASSIGIVLVGIAHGNAVTADIAADRSAVVKLVNGDNESVVEGEVAT